MDIHKPKPWHGVREFLKEYVIIVVGVLTALAAEAVVQSLHEARLSEEARKSVHDELNVDITNLNRRVAREPCIERRLDEIADLLDRAEAAGSFSPPGKVGGPVEPFIYTQRWEAATAGGRTTLLSSDEQRAVGRVYFEMRGIAAMQQEELRAWSHLDALTGLRHLSSEMIYGQRIALSDARNLDGQMRQVFDMAKFHAGAVGVKGDATLFMAPAGKRDADAVPPICEPLGALPPASPKAP